MQIRYDDNNNWLLCPNCGDLYLHHSEVEVFERGEDALTGIRSKTSVSGVQVDTAMKGNPSARRHGLNIYFWCESCGGKHTLSLSQHKGLSILEWSEVGETQEQEED